jgi:hypothetical protein
MREQSDNIGRFFAHRATVYFDQFFENCNCITKIWPTFSAFEVMYACINFDEKWVGLHFGRFLQTLLVTLFVNLFPPY